MSGTTLAVPTTDSMAKTHLPTGDHDIIVTSGGWQPKSDGILNPGGAETTSLLYGVWQSIS